MTMRLKQSASKSQERYGHTKGRKRAAKINDLQLDEIAELTNEGMSVREIEEQLNIPKSTVSYRQSIIRNEYPELLEVSNCPTCPTHVTVTDTVTGTDTATMTYNEIHYNL